MGRSAKPARAEVAARRPSARRAPASGAARVRELEARLAAALEQQAATNEILRLMASSPGDVRPVLDAVALHAARLCNAPFARVMLVDGDVLRIVADHSVDGEAQVPTFPVALKRTSITGRAVVDGATVHHADVAALLGTEYPDAGDNARLIRCRAALAVPLMREGGAYGAIFLWRREPGLFAPDQVELVQTFARQAAIAIDNVRLFKEVDVRNRDLTEALAQQMATSEILRAIAGSPTDVQPVFDIIAQRAGKLCDAEVAVVSRFDGTSIELAAIHGLVPEAVKVVRGLYPMNVAAQTVTARVIRGGSVVHLADVFAEARYEIKDFARAAQYRAGLGVPIIRHGRVIGSIFVGRANPGLFAESQIELLKTFSEQAVIAIENVRLFTEVDSRNRDLTDALERQTATSDILRVMSQSRTDVQPVFDTIVAAALRLCGATSSNVVTFDGELIHVAAVAPVSPDGTDAIRRHFDSYPRPPSRDTANTRAVLTRDVVAIPDVLEDKEYAAGATASAAGYRSVLSVPLMREGDPIGAITVARPQPGLFPDKQITLLKTFADQAVIAIENVRLFTELGDRNHDLTEALEQQTATSEILRVISRSPTDVQPVFDTIALSALTLCRASGATMLTFDGALIHLASVANVNPDAAGAIRKLFPRPPSNDTAGTRAILTRRVVAIPDVLEDSDYSIGNASHFTGFRGVMAVPLIRDDVPIGAITVGRPEPGPFSEKQIVLLQTFADQAVIAIENVRLFTELEARNNDLTEALEQQTATSEILRAISSSPTDVQPVFDIIGESAERLCDAEISVVSRTEGELIRLVALHGVNVEGRGTISRHFPMRLDAETVTARTIRRRVVVHIADVVADPDYESKDAAMVGEYRACLGVPMFREGEVIGAIFVARKQAGLFADSQVQLLRTFADQAVIAIENVRLFTQLDARNRDLTVALEQQTATSDILRVISQSQTNVQPVFDTIVAAALRLCNAGSANVFTFDGRLIQLAAFVNVNRQYVEALRRFYPRPPGRDTAVTRAILTCDVVVIPDVDEDPEYPIELKSLGGGFRSILAVPLIREGNPIGGIAVGRFEPGPFPDTQVDLLKTFADQAVIAIENVRLFTELGDRNRDLTEALEQQTATSEILRVISQSQTDVQPVFDTIAASALKLCRASVANVVTLDGDTMRLPALANVSPQGAAALRRAFPRPVGRDTGAGRAILTGRLVAIPDVLTEPGYAIGDSAHVTGFRSVLAIPLMRDGRPIGAINVGRLEPGPFSDNQIALLQTFADQAVIAIANVRLFKELETRTTELTQSVGELKALSEVGRAVSSTLDLETVLSTIVSRATNLAGMDGGAIYEYDEAKEQFYLHTAERYPAELVDMLRAMPIRRGEGALGRLAVVAEPVQIRNIADDRTYKSRVREILLRLGYQSLLGIPLLREDRLLGGLIMNRKTAGEFAPQVIDLLQTFAAQSALAIQNARLFREIEDKGRQLEIASRHKSEFLANMSHELRTPLNAIIGFSEVLAERMFGEINDKQAEYLADILESGRHLLSLINDILDLSKIEAGRMELEASEFNLPGAIDNTLTLLRERAQRRDVRLGRTIDGAVGTIRADERKVKQVLLNLLSNALKFTPDGGRIDVKAGVRDGMVEISVTDTGVGIAPADLEAVFEEFRQVGTAAKKVEGTGLGLAISRKFIELHGGRIWVTSELGVGSTFAFTLPGTDGAAGARA